MSASVDLARERLLLQEAAILAAATWPAGAIIDRVELLSEASSTQDEARERCGNRAGLMVMALTQHAGRGRLGRDWRHAPGKGIAATFVLSPACPVGEVALRAGLAALAAAQSRVSVPLGMRWPNDVVLRSDYRRKLAGVLVERRDDLFFLGIGLNVLHQPADWPTNLAPRATSLALLGSRDESIFPAARELITQVTRVVAQSIEELTRVWHAADVLIGTTQTFEHDRRRVTGVVEGIEPTSEIRVRTASGVIEHLPAQTTSMIHDDH
ncbi:MAG TPA: hypothetical protein VK157_13210 [Phycisphaerales bacterium]|nr:hypothetical protein [Phycisphaerales bacterium]